MAVAGYNAALWQCQSAVAADEDSVYAADNDDVALFNDSSKVVGASSVSYISDIQVAFVRAVPENEAVDADNNEIQDMGISGLDIQIEGVSGNADNDATTNLVNKLQTWLKDGNTVSNFEKGRYGLRMDNAPQWNVTPDKTPNTFGYHLRDARFTYVGEDKDRVRFVIRLALGGDIASAI
jgi:hypothetical protein